MNTFTIFREGEGEREREREGGEFAGEDERIGKKLSFSPCLLKW